MDHLTLYTSQTDTVLEVLHRDGVCFNRERYIRSKYRQDSEGFLAVYRSFIANAASIVAPPEGAEFPYWAFAQTSELFVGCSSHVLKLAVPRDQAVLFDLYDWNRMLQMRLLNPEEPREKAFLKELKLRGLTVRDVMTTPFYPELRQSVLDSWNALLRHHEALLHGDASGVGGIQAGLWQLREEWIVEER